MGRSYTKEVISLSQYVDEFINYDELEKLPEADRVIQLKSYHAHYFVHVFPKKEIAQLAKKAGIPLRVGTTNRLWHWWFCNRLVRLSRKNSNLHEAQLNMKLLTFLKINTTVGLAEIPDYYGFTKLPALNDEFKQLIDPNKFNLVLHPKSKGSAREWGIPNFEKLAQLLPANSYKIFVSGTATDRAGMEKFLESDHVMDLTGKMPLQQFIAFINACQGLVAASTGPLHIAAALNKKAVGLFVPMRPIHPGRWAPLGKRASFLVEKDNCVDCKKGGSCLCIQSIKPERVIEELNKP